jgi:lipoate-protein ligase A
MAVIDSYIISNNSDPGFNLAAEDYLFNQRQDNIVFAYTNEPCVVLGSNQSIHIEADLGYCRSRNIKLVRRISGGGAVYQDFGNMNFCIIINRQAGKFPLGVDFLKPLVEALNKMGIPVITGKRKDLWLDGFKISGTASHIGNKRALHHGTIMYDVNINNLNHSLKAVQKSKHEELNNQIEPVIAVKAIQSVPSPVINIKTFLESKGQKVYSKNIFFDRLGDQFMKDFNISAPSSFTQEEICKIEEIKKELYDKVSWIYKK